MAVSITWTLAEWPHDGSEEDQQVFLGTGERAHWAGLRFEKRRREWLFGRILAKRLLTQVYPSVEPADIEIMNEPEGAPYAVLAGERLPGCLSITHRSGMAAAAWCADGAAVGLDLEQVETRTAGFVEDYFTPAERDFVNSLAAPDRDRWVAVIWSAKEAVLKVLRKGLRLDTRQVEILPGEGGGFSPEGWQPLTVRCALLPSVSAFWRREGEHVLTLAVGDPAVDGGPLRVTRVE